MTTLMNKAYSVPVEDDEDYTFKGEDITETLKKIINVFDLDREQRRKLSSIVGKELMPEW